MQTIEKNRNVKRVFSIYKHRMRIEWSLRNSVILIIGEQPSKGHVKVICQGLAKTCLNFSKRLGSCWKRSYILIFDPSASKYCCSLAHAGSLVRSGFGFISSILINRDWRRTEIRTPRVGGDSRMQQYAISTNVPYSTFPNIHWCRLGQPERGVGLPTMLTVVPHFPPIAAQAYPYIPVRVIGRPTAARQRTRQV